MKKAPTASKRTPSDSPTKKKATRASSTTATRPVTSTAKRSAASKTRAAASKARTSAGASDAHASRHIDQRIQELGGWRGETLARMRALIRQADPEVTEEWKWENPVWSHHGIICTGEAYKKAVKLTFAKGAGVADPKRLFNASLEGNTRRAIDIPEGTQVDATAFKALIKAAVALNASLKKK